ncbi:MAG: SAM-dependent methyltransferase, partial [Gammaproteobacteria bacterium]|nr:SAM-dependent methyltransferase [Gammaproteobacteria bacterium]
MNPLSLPEPEAAAIAASNELADVVRAAIDAEGGWIDFEQYMQIVLYEPGLGYYSAGATKLGEAGDFTTAPERSEIFGGALARFLARAMAPLERHAVLELGAGSGALAEQLLRSLPVAGRGGVDYAILEPSAELKARQRERLAGFGDRVRWIESLPQRGFDGIVVANEVADAIPVARFVKHADGVVPLGIAADGNRFVIETGPESERLTRAVDAIEAALDAPLPVGYRSEVCLQLAPWIEAIAAAIGRGGLLLIDYGMTRRDYYRHERTDGTLICHYRHRAHDDPLLWPGLQDLSAWVDFSAAAAAAEHAGLDVSGYTTQAQFLVESLAGDAALAERVRSPADASALNAL